jgi:hypothetical protein
LTASARIFVVVATASYSAAAGAQVRIDDRSGCLSPAPTAARLESVLRAQPGAERIELRVSVTGRRLDDGKSEIQLAARSAWDELLLERRYALERADCASAGELLGLVLERFLAGFPAERRRALRARASGPPPARAARVVEVALHLALAGELAPLGGGAELGAGVELGPERHRFGAIFLARGGAPRELGQGRWLEVALALGLGYRYAVWAWQPAVELRAGATLVQGLGYDASYREWTPGLEAVAALDRRWRRIALGLQVAVTLLRHRILTEDGLYSERLPAVRIGLRLTVPLAARRF